MKDNHGRGKVFAAVAGAVVGAGAVIAGAVALADKKNQGKVKEALNKAINSAEKVTKEAKMKVRKI